jgi:hypothetical protein
MNAQPHLLILAKGNQGSGAYLFRLSDEDRVLRECDVTERTHARATVRAIAWAGGTSSIAYVIGSGASASVCRRLGVRLRKNRPGQGAPKKSSARVALNARVRPDVMAGFQARAKAGGKSLGVVLDEAFDATESPPPRRNKKASPA